MEKTAIMIANGCEEIEALTVVDLLRRAGIGIDMISITSEKRVTGSHGICFETDLTADEFDPASYDGVILPGGMPGTIHLGECELLCSWLQKFAAEGKRLAAICAAPSVLGQLGLLKGKKATCYPGFEEQLTGADVRSDGVVTDGLVTTAKGLGVALALGLELVKLLQGAETSDAIRASIQSPELA